MVSPEIDVLENDHFAGPEMSLIAGKTVISTGMTREVQRVEAAIEQAQQANACAIISSGDPGIYAMAGLVFEVCQQQNIAIQPPAAAAHPGNTKPPLEVEVVPGIPALCAGAALLGIPRGARPC